MKRFFLYMSGVLGLGGLLVAAPAGACGVESSYEGFENAGCGCDTDSGEAKATNATRANGFDKMPAEGTKAHCPVMNAEFEVKKNSPHSVYKGKYYVFCCAGCKPQFDADPEKYVKSLK